MAKDDIKLLLDKVEKEMWLDTLNENYKKIGKNKIFSAFKEILKDKDMVGLLAFAAWEKTPLQIFKKLVKLNDKKIDEQIIDNPYVPESILEAFAKSTDKELKKKAELKIKELKSRERDYKENRRD
ncbi:MAG: hypothetical protein ACP5RT_00415 [Candidatus Micrarchaeia archaeon]